MSLNFGIEWRGEVVQESQLGTDQMLPLVTETGTGALTQSPAAKVLSVDSKNGSSDKRSHVLHWTAVHGILSARRRRSRSFYFTSTRRTQKKVWYVVNSNDRKRFDTIFS